MINLKKFNEHVHTEHFKMKGIHVLKENKETGCTVVLRDWRFESAANVQSISTLS